MASEEGSHPGQEAASGRKHQKDVPRAAEEKGCNESAVSRGEYGLPLQKQHDVHCQRGHQEGFCNQMKDFRTGQIADQVEHCGQGKEAESQGKRERASPVDAVISFHSHYLV